MSTKPLMLEGLTPTASEADDGLLRKFRREKQQLEDDLRETHQELDDLRTEKERMERSIRNLRQQLSPLHRGLRALFGEIELAIGEEDALPTPRSSATQTASGSDPRWESFKGSFPGAAAEIIDALLIHGDMRVANLATLLKRDPRTIGKAAATLRNAGAVSQAGGVVSLRRN